MRRILVTSALPYANGPIHLGHLVEYIQTDIWARFQRLRGHDCRYFCADDTHGTAIMIRAASEGRSELDLIGEMSAAHQRDFAGFSISFDHYSSTHAEENREVCHLIWDALRKADMIVEKEVEQLFDPEKNTFLADRFVRGTCPRCGAKDQPGDNCSACGATYGPAELLDPRSTLSGATPILRSAPHLFVRIEHEHEFLSSWTQSGTLPKESANYLKNYFLHEPLRDWDVSRPAPYFGFEIPDHPGSYWYVWFDAPIGYIGTTLAWCRQNGESLDAWWRSPETEIHHFIGKDIQYFHTLFWPAELKVAGFSLPSRIHIHGFLTVDGKKMSKSDGTFITAETYLEHLDPAALRYYYASRLSPKVEDIDLNLEDFTTKVNTDLVGKVVNLAARTAKFVQGSGLAPSYPDDGGLFAHAAAQGAAIAEAYEADNFSLAMRLIMDLADRANPYIEQAAPWELRKQPGQEPRIQEICTVGLNLFRQLAVYLAPVLPQLAAQAGQLLHSPITSWDDASKPIVGTPVAPFQHLMRRVDPAAVQAMVDASAQPDPMASQTPTPQDSPAPLAAEPLAPEISFDDFAKVDLRVARVLQAEAVPEARKLLKLTLGLGGEESRTVFAGIKSAYQPEELVGRLVVMVANLAPRQMKFGLSEGMVVAAGPGGEEVFLLAPDEGAQPGQRVH